MNQKNLTANANLFKKILDQFPIALISDENGNYRYVNPGWCRYMGYQPEDVCGKPVRSIAPDTKVDEVLQTGDPVMGYQITDKEGHSLFNHCFPIREDGRIIGTAVLTFFSTLEEAVSFSSEISRLTEQLGYYQNELKKLRGSRYSIDEIIGSGTMMQKLKKEIRNVARTSSTVLIEGETGCGKELVANAIHDLSVRSEQPFIKINCAAIPPDLVESELFGYEKGAFTGADRRGKAGLFEAADNGSLFLDEIHQMPYFMQPKLLRALQEKEIQRVGGRTVIPFDSRIIAATNRSLEMLVEEEKFREDLYYRLNVVTIQIPPLRERAEDIPELLEHARKKLNHTLGLHVEGFTSEVEERLMAYTWPGNIRELNNVIERAMNHSLNGILGWDSFTDYFSQRAQRQTAKPVSAQRAARESSSPEFDTIADAKKSLEKQLIQDCLKRNRYNKTKTAMELGISRTMLYQKLKIYGISL